MKIIYCVVTICIIFSSSFIPLTFADVSPRVKVLNCPHDLLVGEREEILFELRNENRDKSKIIINNMEISSNGNFGGNDTNVILSQKNELPLILDYPSNYVIQGKYSSPTAGIQYIDINLFYTIGDDLKELSFYQELCSLEVSEKDSTWESVWGGVIIAGMSAAFAGGATTLVKMYFVRSNFKFEQNILAEKAEYSKLTDHQHWLFQKMHTLAEKYYTPIAKYAWDAMQDISKADSSKNKHSKNNAYYSTVFFVSKYNDFKKTVGANYLFKDREYENTAILKAQAVLTLLPFDVIDRESISLDVLKNEKTNTKISFSGTPYSHFIGWIDSDFCSKSKILIGKKLNAFQEVLDHEGERIQSPDFFAKNKKLTIKDSPNPDHDIWISYVSNKVVQPGQEFLVYGQGFQDTSRYQFYFEDEIISSTVISDESVKIIMPTSHSIGTFDIYAKCHKDSDNWETIGIPIHVENVKSLSKLPV